MKARLTIILFAAIAPCRAGSGGTPLDRVPPRFRLPEEPPALRADAIGGGAKLYARECSVCHGCKGEGIGHAPPLASDQVRRAPAGAIFRVLRDGSLRHGMPSFAHLPEPQRWQIIAYLRTLQPADPHR